MVDYREILRLQSLGHNITQIAGALHSLFFATPKYLKMQTSFPKVAAGNSSFLHVSPA